MNDDYCDNCGDEADPECEVSAINVDDEFVSDHYCSDCFDEMMETL